MVLEWWFCFYLSMFNWGSFGFGGSPNGVLRVCAIVFQIVNYSTGQMVLKWWFCFCLSMFNWWSFNMSGFPLWWNSQGAQDLVSFFLKWSSVQQVKWLEIGSVSAFAGNAAENPWDWCFLHNACVSCGTAFGVSDFSAWTRPTFVAFWELTNFCMLSLENGTRYRMKIRGH